MATSLRLCDHAGKERVALSNVVSWCRIRSLTWLCFRGFVMEIGNEISQKLRAVIKTKLKELGSYVDDELPDYIMVMLANKRSQEQMTEDLALFLGSNTAFFTDWLVSIIQKLQDATTLIESPERSVLDKTGTESVKLKETRTEKADTPPKLSSKEKRKSPHRTDGKEEQKNKALKSSGHRKNDKPRSSSGTEKSVEMSSKTSVRKRKHSSSDEDDGRISQPHSIVKVQDRKPTLPPSKQASSSLLRKAVAEAHLSVNKPVLSSSLKYDPTSPPSPIRSHSYEEKQQQKELLLQQHRELQRQLQQMEHNDGVVEEEVEEDRDKRDEENLEKEKEIKEEIKNQTTIIGETLQDTSVTQEFEEPVIELRISEAEALEYSAEPVEGDTRIVAFADSQVGGEDSEEERRRKRKKRRAVKSKKERPSSPKFIVTLDGVGSDMEDKYDDQVKKERKKKKTKKDDTTDDFEEIETSNVEIDTKATPEMIVKEKPTIKPITFDMDVGDDGEEDEDTSPIKNRLAEKCKFWPECKNGDDCPFFHPTVTCRSFPSCRFGDNCRFIHPPCKFDGRCANSSCPYTHKLKNKQETPTAGTPGLGAMLPSPNFVAPLIPSGQPIPCKFFPACTKTDCPFFHPPPKPCRFGTNCTRPNCIFSHPAKPSSLKWVSPLLHVSERRFALSEQKVTSMPVL